MYRVHSRYELIKHATSVYIVREQLRRHQPLVHTLARSEYFPIRVVHVLFHTRVLFKFKSSCTVRSYNLVSLYVTFLCMYVHIYAWYIYLGLKWVKLSMKQS